MAEFQRLADAQISPDGAYVACVAGPHFSADTRAAERRIWLAPADASTPPQPLDTGEARALSAPRWSPDSRRLAYLADQAGDERPQIWLADYAGGNQRCLTSLPGKIEELAWSPDGAQLAFLMTDPEPAPLQQRRAAGNDVIEVEQHHCWRRAWVLNLATMAAAPRTGAVQVWEFSWAPDGGMVLLIGDEPYEWSWFTARLARIGPHGGEPVLIYSAPEKQFAYPRVSPDGRSVAFLSSILSDRGSNGGDVLLLPLDGGAPPRNLTPGYPGSIVALQWGADGRTLDYLAFEQGDAAIGRIELAGGARSTLWRDAVGMTEIFAGSFRAHEQDVFALVREDATHPPELWVARHGAPEKAVGSRQPAVDSDALRRVAADCRLPAGELSWCQLTSFNAHVAEYALGETRELRWRARDGQAIAGQLVLPPGYQPGTRLPLIAWVHGGPQWLWMRGFYGAGRLPPQAFAAAGYAVLLPNPRGSIGWGVEFGEACIGDFGGEDYADILAGVDHVIALGIADPDRLGIGGWSYGGFISAWAVTQTSRFKAAVMGAGICNWRSFHGVAAIGAWDRIGLRADPYTQAEEYEWRSPIAHVQHAGTPTLILHGADDTIVPVSQGYEFFRALKDRGVPTELVVYPREAHGFHEWVHNLDRIERYVEWFRRYIPL